MVDYSTITDALPLAQVVAALIAVGATVAGVLVIRKGVAFVLGLIGGDEIDLGPTPDWYGKKPFEGSDD